MRSLSVEELLRFNEARIRILGENSCRDGIGRLSEKSLHRILKLYVEEDESLHECAYLGSVADIINGRGIFEIQTRSAERLLPKLEKFLQAQHVTVVIPVITERWVHWLDKESGELSEAKRSPKRDSVYTVCRELYRIRKYLSNDRLSVKLIFLTADVFRYLDGRDKTRKRGATKIESLPRALIGELDLASARDYAALLPSDIPDEFTAKELATAAKFPKSLASAVAGTLAAAGAIKRLRREGKAFIYSRA